MQQQSFYPALNQIIDIDKIPEPFKDGIDKISNKLFYRVYHVDKSTHSDAAYHYLILISLS